MRCISTCYQFPKLNRPNYLQFKNSDYQFRFLDISGLIVIRQFVERVFECAFNYCVRHRLDFERNIIILTQILILDQNFEFWPKFWFLKQLLYLTEILTFDRILFLTEILKMQCWPIFWTKFAKVGPKLQSKF